MKKAVVDCQLCYHLSGFFEIRRPLTLSLQSQGFLD